MIGALAGPSQQPDGLGEVVGEALERLDGLTEPENEHERGVGGQLDVDVVGGAQLGGQLIAGAAVPRTSITIRSGSQPAIPGRPTIASPTTATPGIRSIASRARIEASIVRSSRASPWAASWRRAASSEARSSEFGLVERTRRTQRETSSGSMRPLCGDVEHRRLGEAADDLVRGGEDGVGPQAQRRLGQPGVKTEMRAPRAVDDKGGTTGVGDLGTAGDVGRHAVVGRRHDERCADVAGPPQRLVERLRGHAVRHPQLVVVLGRHEARSAAAEHEPVDDRGVRVALDEHVVRRAWPAPGRARDCPGWRRW